MHACTDIYPRPVIATITTNALLYDCIDAHIVSVQAYFKIYLTCYVYSYFMIILMAIY